MLKSLKIGNLTTKNNLFLAPMCGITDLPFREMVSEFGGCGLMFTEMMPSRSIYRKDYNKKAKNTFDINAIQISGNDTYYMSEAVKKNIDLGAELIDINMGCPVKKVVNGFAGSAIMKDEKLAKEIISAVVKSAGAIPVSLKMRMGWDNTNLNSPTIAKIAESEGIKLITIHGRTRSQMYNGNADWKFIRNVKEAVNIPVIANGDIKTTDDVKKAMQESNADGVMIARGIYGKPYLFKQIEAELKNDKWENPQDMDTIVLRHLEKMLEHHGERIAINLVRKHISWYSNGMNNSAEFRKIVNTINDISQLRETIHAFFSNSKIFDITK